MAEIMNIELIWDQYRASLKAFLHSKISNSADVEDLLQEILIKSHNNLSSVKSEDSFKSWLFQIAKNTIIDFYRQKGKAKDIGPEDLWYGDNKEETQHVLSKCVEPFIRALPEDSSALLLAVDIQGKAQKQYAADIGISYSTLKSRVQKARRQLHAVFDDCCHLSVDARGNIIGFTPKAPDCKPC
ncbi:MAG: RNA polymerase sigma factor SigZ [Kordiimonas sp.]